MTSPVWHSIGYALLIPGATAAVLAGASWLECRDRLAAGLLVAASFAFSLAVFLLAVTS